MRVDHGIVTFSPTIDGRIVYSCQLAEGEQGIGVCLLEPALDRGSASLRILVAPGDEPGRLSAARARGPWVVYALVDPPQRIVARNHLTAERVEVARISAGSVRLPLGPAFALSGDSVIFADEAATATGGVQTSLWRYDLKTHGTQKLYTLPAGRVISDVSADAQRVVYCQETTDDQTFESEIELLDLRDGGRQRLSSAGLASMPNLYGGYVVWKLADVGSYGGIWLYSLAARPPRGQILSGGKDDGQREYDMPTIGEAGVTWLTEGRSSVFRYRPESQKLEVLDEDGDRAQVAGRYMAWISASVPAWNQEALLITDFSEPAARAPASPAR